MKFVLEGLRKILVRKDKMSELVDYNELKENIDGVLYGIREAEKISCRPEASVKLCAVSKFHPVEAVIGAMKCGQFLFGENRVKEADAKFAQLADYVSMNPGIISGKPELHIIGSLQSNKIKKAAEIASCIQSVDREVVLVEAEKVCSKIGKTLKVFLELHTGEDSKSGYATADELLKSAENIALRKYPHIELAGLMTMAPFTEEEALIRKSFAELRMTSERLCKEFPDLNASELSMGMSQDYRIAIEEGSTMVRVGTAIFGQRNYA